MVTPNQIQPIAEYNLLSGIIRVCKREIDMFRGHSSLNLYFRFIDPDQCG